LSPYFRRETNDPIPSCGSFCDEMERGMRGLVDGCTRRSDQTMRRYPDRRISLVAAESLSGTEVSAPYGRNIRIGGVAYEYLLTPSSWA
jgi:hypothetical protein